MGDAFARQRSSDEETETQSYGDVQAKMALAALNGDKTAGHA